MTDGPHLVREVHPELSRALGTLWRDVVRAGGPVSYRVDAPEEDIRAGADAEIEKVRAGRQYLHILGSAQALAGTVFVRPDTGAIFCHRAEVHRLMVRPELQGRGWGSRLLDAAVAHARAVGLEQLLLAVRGGTRLPAFYVHRGWTEVGVWPGALVIAPGVVRDQHWLQLRLGGTP